MNQATLDKVTVRISPPKRKKTAVVSFRMSPEEQRRAYEIAEFYGVSFNELVKQLIKQAEETAKAHGMAQ